ncbi:hypothetical protein EDD16DRAFT_437942 [Pisolithus croceorrhizus]|nr:hypothetical protein EDD16DRAFT_437942 [Pisolithus croceorrhizus]
MTIASEISGKGHSSLVETPRTRCECASQRQHDSRYAYTAVETRRAMGNKVGGNKLFCQASNEYNTLNIKSQSRRKLFVGEKGTNVGDLDIWEREMSQRLISAPASDLLVEDDEGTWAPRVSACVSSYCETRTKNRWTGANRMVMNARIYYVLERLSSPTLRSFLCGTSVRTSCCKAEDLAPDWAFYPGERPAVSPVVYVACGADDKDEDWVFQGPPRLSS